MRLALKPFLFALTRRRRAQRITIIAGLMVLVMLLADTLVSNDIINWQGTWLGGDFLAFYGAGQMALLGEGQSVWEPSLFEAHLQSIQPFQPYGLTWQYPPTTYFLIMPFALLPYKLAFWLWTIAGLLALVAALRIAGLQSKNLLLMLGAPIVLVAVVQGQNSLFFGALLILALGVPDRRPLLAGLAAGLLTMKPHLGLLIPLAYLAGGYWRSFGMAALSALVLGLAASLFFGFEGWGLFVDSLIRVENNLSQQTGLYPFARMISLYSALGLAGVPATIALAVHGVGVLLLAYVVAMVWRRQMPLAYKAAITIPATLLISPYSYYYEMVALLFPLMILVKQRYDVPLRAYLVMAWPLTLYLPTIQDALPLQIGFFLTTGVLFLSLRMARSQLTSASATASLSPGSQKAGPIGDLHDRPV